MKVFASKWKCPIKIYSIKLARQHEKNKRNYAAISNWGSWNESQKSFLTHFSVLNEVLAIFWSLCSYSACYAVGFAPISFLTAAQWHEVYVIDIYLLIHVHIYVCSFRFCFICHWLSRMFGRECMSMTLVLDRRMCILSIMLMIYQYICVYVYSLHLNGKYIWSGSKWYGSCDPAPYTWALRSRWRWPSSI